MRSDSGYGKGLRNMPRTNVNIAVLAPTASAMVAIATAEKPGWWRRRRHAYRKSSRTLRRVIGEILALNPVSSRRVRGVNQSSLSVYTTGPWINADTQGIWINRRPTENV